MTGAHGGPGSDEPVGAWSRVVDAGRTGRTAAHGVVLTPEEEPVRKRSGTRLPSAHTARTRGARTRARWAVSAVVLLGALAAWLGGGVAGHLVPYDTKDPASQSGRADAAVARAAGFDAGPGIVALIDTPAGSPAAGTADRIRLVAAAMGQDPGIASVATPLDPTPDSTALIAADGRSEAVIGTFRPQADRAKQDVVRRLTDRLAASPWVRIGGYDAFQVHVNEESTRSLVRSESIAFPIVFLLSLFFFRSLVASLLPPLVGALTVAVTFAVLRGVAAITDVSVFALNLAGGLGLGLAIDYSLLYVARYREEAALRTDRALALRITTRRVGRTLAFSSLTISGALAALLVFPENFLFSMGIVGVVVPLAATAVTLTVLPAVLTLLGPRLETGAPRWLRRRADRDARPQSAGLWYRTARVAQRRPVLVAFAGLAAMTLLSLPVFTASFRTADESVLPASDTTRQVAAQVRAEYPGVSDAIQVVIAGPADQAAAVVAGIGRLPGLAAEPRSRALEDGWSLARVVPAGDPLGPAAKDLVTRIRALPAPAAASVLVGGESARALDQDHALRAELPLALLVVLASVVLFIHLLTGSAVLPLKSLAMNALTIGVAFGSLAMVFGTLDATQPILVAVLLLGLSTDYTVFLLARIREARQAGLDDADAVASGVERTGRVLSAAALMFCAAVGPFLATDVAILRQIGLGLVVGVLFDAFLVRALLVPSLMALLGRWNWWSPAPLRRLHERLGPLEGGEEVPVVVPASVTLSGDRPTPPPVRLPRPLPATFSTPSASSIPSVPAVTTAHGAPRHRRAAVAATAHATIGRKETRR